MHINFPRKTLKLKYFILKLDKVYDGVKLARILLEHCDENGCTGRFLAEEILNCELQ